MKPITAVAVGFAAILSTSMGIMLAEGLEPTRTITSIRTVQDAPSPTPHYALASFAPIRVVGSERVRFVNPAQVVKLDEKQLGVTTLSLANGEELRAVGSIVEVAKIMRVDVWLEEVN